jgi:hypothetical protein
MLRVIPFVPLLALTAFAHDWLIVPGERVGPVTAKSTEASLRAAFGSDAVVARSIQIDKTVQVPGLEIYSSRPGESLAVVWPRKEQNQWWPLLVIPCYGTAQADCRWRTASGVRTGLPVAELEKLNGRPFLLYPSEKSRHWTEPAWKEGRLATELGEDVDLAFADPGYPFTSDEPYVETNATPLAGRPLVVDRFFIFLLSGTRAAPANDSTIVLGERIGPVPIHAAFETLRESLGAAQVHRVVTTADEGMGDIPGVSIFFDQKGREVLLRRDGNLVCGTAHPLGASGEYVGANGYRGCQWHIAGGIPLSAPVATLERLNGRPFVFNGCCFDLGGLVTSWEGGKLSASPAVRIAVGCPGVQPQRLMGEKVIRSDDPDIRRQKCLAEVINF